MATKANLIIDAGTDFSTTITIVNNETEDVVDLTGYEARAQMRKHYSSVSYVEFGASIDPEGGDVTLTLSSEETTALKPGRYVYDVEVVNQSGIVSRILEGIVTITPNVTR